MRKAKKDTVNQTWTLNAVEGQHSADALREIVEALQEAYELGDYDLIVEVLERFGENIDYHKLFEEQK